MIVYRKAFHGLHLVFRWAVAAEPTPACGCGGPATRPTHTSPSLVWPLKLSPEGMRQIRPTHPPRLPRCPPRPRLYGSAIVRTALWGLLAAVQTALLYVLVPGHFTVYFEEGRVTVFTVLSTMLGEFFLVGLLQWQRTTCKTGGCCWLGRRRRVCSQPLPKPGAGGAPVTSSAPLPCPAPCAALLVIFRQNAGYGRFREGRIRLQAMSAAWTDACIKVGGLGSPAARAPPISSTKDASECCWRWLGLPSPNLRLFARSPARRAGPAL